LTVYDDRDLTEAQATAVVDSMIRRCNRRVRAIRQRRSAYYQEQEIDDGPEIDMSMRQEGESYSDWWERIGCKQHNAKPWQFI